MKKKTRHLLYIAASFVTLNMGFTNCDTVNSSHSGAVNSASGTVDSTLQALCEQALMNAFATSYQPFVSDRALCLSCHTEGGSSPFKFASADPATAFRSFMQVGADRINMNSVNSGHAAGITGPALQPRVTAARAVWDPAYANYQACLSSGQSGGTKPSALRMVDKSAPSLYFGDGRVVTLSWDVSSSEISPATAQFPALFSIDARIDYQLDANGQKIAMGYAFANPRLQMFTGESEVDIEGVVVLINGTEGRNLEAFKSARKTSRGIDPVMLYSGEVKVPFANVSSADIFGISFGYFNLRLRTDNPPTPPIPVMSVNNSYARTSTVPVTISGDGSARRWCLTASNGVPTSTALPCPGFEGQPFGATGLPAGWRTTRPANFDLTTIGHLVTNGEVVNFNLWIANSDLKINSSPASSQVTFDAVAPPSPVFSSITLGTTQMADINGLQDSTEIVTWCAVEAALMNGVQNPGGCVFTSVKPTMVGLKGGGTRYIAVFARDRAGNTSASATATLVNTFGMITYDQLTNPTAGARAVILNRCNSCHGAGGPQQTLWDSTSYANTVTEKTNILNRIFVAHPSGAPLLDTHESSLLQLWLTQTTTPVQL